MKIIESKDASKYNCCVKQTKCSGDICMAWVENLGDSGYCGMLPNHNEATLHIDAAEDHKKVKQKDRKQE